MSIDDYVYICVCGYVHEWRVVSTASLLSFGQIFLQHKRSVRQHTLIVCAVLLSLYQSYKSYPLLFLLNMIMYVMRVSSVASVLLLFIIVITGHLVLTVLHHLCYC